MIDNDVTLEEFVTRFIPRDTIINIYDAEKYYNSKNKKKCSKLWKGLSWEICEENDIYFKMTRNCEKCPYKNCNVYAVRPVSGYGVKEIAIDIFK